MPPHSPGAGHDVRALVLPTWLSVCIHPKSPPNLCFRMRVFINTIVYGGGSTVSHGFYRGLWVRDHLDPQKQFWTFKPEAFYIIRQSLLNDSKPRGDRDRAVRLKDDLHASR